AGGVSLPMRTRVTANLGYSLRLQNADFLPHTINPALTSPPLLQRSLNGNVQTILLNLNATSRPISPLTLSAKYRLYDLHDLSDQVSSTGTVVNDRTVSSPRRSSVWDYSRQNFDGDARWQLFRPLALTLGGGWERWHRNQHREARLTDEATGKAAIDATPADWILARLTYRPSFRRVYQYHTEAHAEHSVNEEDPSFDTQKQSQRLVKFDEGSRNRHRVDVLFQLTPTEFFTVTPTASYYTDDYIDSDLGLQKGTGWSAGIDLNWTPFERVAISAGYMHERIEQGMRSRFRPTVGGVIADFESFDWISWNIDTIDTIHAGVKATLIPKVLDLTLGGNYSSSVGRIETRNPAAPSESTTANQLSAQAKPMPAFEDTLLRLDTKLTYHFAKAWSASLGYVFESLVSHDWRTDRLNPFIPGISSIWLGNDQRNYAAHIVGATLAYRFK
ncbi:MAG: MtrB/PioB family outer membrane beta-barrel protein, partial [Dehalococcoidia bacterium]|nr:MtrB/PioB family outer membrane beta-barrel protein [Dehalococcoidia bacterium]